VSEYPNLILGIERETAGRVSSLYLIRGVPQVLAPHRGAQVTEVQSSVRGPPTARRCREYEEGILFGIVRYEAVAPPEFRSKWANSDTT
jgi:hypothetical protein